MKHTRNGHAPGAIGKSALAAFLAASVFLCPVAAHSQKEPPPGQDAGAAGERFQKDTERTKALLQRSKGKAPQIQFTGEEREEPESTVSFVLKEVKVTGSTVFEEKDLRPIYGSYLGKTADLSILTGIADAIREKYRKKGYFSADVHIPEQEVSGGVVEIIVKEGRMGEVKVEGAR